MEPRRHSLNVKNTGGDGTHEIVFYDWGNVDAATVTVCVHGLTRNAQDFDIIAQALANTGRRVLSINMAGRGESAWLADPMGYNYGTYVNDCIAVMDNFHLRSVEWLGTSMGGIIGMTIAAHHPQRIGGAGLAEQHPRQQHDRCAAGSQSGLPDQLLHRLGHVFGRVGVW